MTLLANLGTLLTGGLGKASRLLAAAQAGDALTVAEVMCAHPQLASYCGLHGKQSALHRAAAAGHLDVCQSILEPLKQRTAATEALVAAGRRKPAAPAKWRRLLDAALNQRNGKGFTPLMLACRGGHALVAAYLLREGADPLASDEANRRTALHYAAAGGHVECLRLLCGEGTVVPGPQGPRRLRDVIVEDMQVSSCRYIDQRAFGGLTALHFAVVTGNLEAVQALLQAGASIMVKTDGEAYLGDEYLVPGSTPLHIAVIVGSVSAVHSLLQSHAELMNVVGQILDERGRRPWEGHSRTDIRSMRNQFRKLPFHLARDRGAPQLTQLVDPRIPVEAALDAARDTEHGIGPKRLQTILAMVLQQQLLGWLDRCQLEADTEAAAAARQGGAATPGTATPLATAFAGDAALPEPRTSPSPSVQAAVTAIAALQQGSGTGRGRREPSSGGGRREPSIAAIPECAAEAQEGAEEAGTEGVPPSGLPLAAPDALEGAQAQWTGAEDEAGAELPSISPFAHAPPLAGCASLSAPVTPARPSLGVASSAPVPASLPNPPMARVDRLPSLHGYMGLLSVKRERSRSVENAHTLQSLMASGGLMAPHRHRASSQAGATEAEGGNPGMEQRGVGNASRLHRQISLPTGTFGGGAARTRSAAAGCGAEVAVPQRPRFLSEEHPSAARSAAGPTLTVVPQLHHRRSSSHSSSAAGMLNVLSTLRGRLMSVEGGGASGADSLATIGAPGVPVTVAGGGAAAEVQLSDSEIKDCCKVSDGDDDPSVAGSEESWEDQECGVCLDHAVEVAFAGCQHKLCIGCARNLTKQEKKPPHCPFCRRLVFGFERVSVTSRPPTAVHVRAD